MLSPQSLSLSLSCSFSFLVLYLPTVLLWVSILNILCDPLASSIFQWALSGHAPLGPCLSKYDIEEGTNEDAGVWTLIHGGMLCLHWVLQWGFMNRHYEILKEDWDSAHSSLVPLKSNKRTRKWREPKERTFTEYRIFLMEKQINLLNVMDFYSVVKKMLLKNMYFHSF